MYILDKKHHRGEAQESEETDTCTFHQQQGSAHLSDFIVNHADHPQNV